MADDSVTFPKWLPHLKAALDQTDPHKMLDRVKEAEQAISERFHRISGSKSHSKEIAAIEEAMDVLDVLKRKAQQLKAS